jgi:hypothetical protein
MEIPCHGLRAAEKQKQDLVVASFYKQAIRKRV